MTAARAEQPLVLRITHWANVPLLAVMAASGLQILAAFPEMGAKGAPAGWYPLQGWTPPAWARAGDWLAGARHVHFGVAWLFVANAAVYLVWLAVTDEWRRRAFLPRRDGRNAWQTFAAYLRLRPPPPEQGLYNGLQRFAYTLAIVLGAIEVLSGLALYKPVQFSALAALFGGYEGARAIHLLGLAALLAFTVAHVVLVILHPRAFASIFTGGRRA
ncbi:MAG TPA: cytochrome b/b6 domain-containing protein [Myxococcales bacterium]|nr:cytochrome b/b6 domain-containing protein [Myxococcales bacterium]